MMAFLCQRRVSFMPEPTDCSSAAHRLTVSDYNPFTAHAVILLLMLTFFMFAISTITEPFVHTHSNTGTCTHTYILVSLLCMLNAYCMYTTLTTRNYIFKTCPYFLQELKQDWHTVQIKKRTTFCHEPFAFTMMYNVPFFLSAIRGAFLEAQIALCHSWVTHLTFPPSQELRGLVKSRCKLVRRRKWLRNIFFLNGWETKFLDEHFDTIFAVNVGLISPWGVRQHLFLFSIFFYW